MERFKNATEEQIKQAQWNAETVYVYDNVGVYCLFHSQEEAVKKFRLQPTTIQNYYYKFSRKSKDKFLKELAIILGIEYEITETKTRKKREATKVKEQRYKRNHHYAYLMKNEKEYYKVGKSSKPTLRKRQLNYQSNFGNDYNILHTWEFSNAEDAYEMEIWLHRYFRQIGGELHGQDHFLNVFKKIDFEFLNKKAEEIKKNSKEWLDKIA